jgi:hypothetical protein
MCDWLAGNPRWRRAGRRGEHKKSGELIIKMGRRGSLFKHRGDGGLICRIIAGGADFLKSDFVCVGRSGKSALTQICRNICWIKRHPSSGLKLLSFHVSVFIGCLEKTKGKRMIGRQQKTLRCLGSVTLTIRMYK